MTLDTVFAELLEPLMSEIKAARAELAELKNIQQARSLNVKRLIYDADQLQQEFGYSKHEAYAILRSHGAKQRGRLRITFDRLLDYQRGSPCDENE